MYIQEKILKARADVLPVCFDTIPLELIAHNNWAVWKYIFRDGKLKKPPFIPRTGIFASTNDPNSWGSFSEARNAYATGKWDGIGYRLTKDAEIVGIDIDDCIIAGQIDTNAQWIIENLATYTEISPSGKGIRLFVIGKMPGTRNKNNNVEIYAEKRYLTITGQHVPGTPSFFNTDQALLNLVYYQRIILPAEKQEKMDRPAIILSPSQPQEKRGGRFTRVSSRSEDEIISYMLSEATNRDDLRRYFEGDESLWGEKARHSSKSQAVYRFVRHLIFWTDGDTSKIDAIFRKIKLYDEKWDRVGKQTIENALNPPSQI